jgi:hypothetical protein
MDFNEPHLMMKRESVPSINPSSPKEEERKHFTSETASPTASYDVSDLLSRVP